MECFVLYVNQCWQWKLGIWWHGDGQYHNWRWNDHSQLHEHTSHQFRSTSGRVGNTEWGGKLNQLSIHNLDYSSFHSIASLVITHCVTLHELFCWPTVTFKFSPYVYIFMCTYMYKSFGKQINRGLAGDRIQDFLDCFRPYLSVMFTNVLRYLYIIDWHVQFISISYISMSSTTVT